MSDVPADAMTAIVRDTIINVCADSGRPYDLTEEAFEVHGNSHVVLELSSTSHGTARLTAHITAGLPLLDVTVGEATSFEMELRDSSALYPDERRELQGLVRAVLEGEVTETLRYRGDRIVRASGDVILQGQRVRVRWGGPGCGLVRRRTTHRAYHPY